MYVIVPTNLTLRVNQIWKNHEEFQYEGQNPGYQTETEKSIENNIWTIYVLINVCDQ